MMYFDEYTISRGLDELAVKWVAKYEKFRPAPVVRPKRDWLHVSSSASVTPKEAETASRMPEMPSKSPLGLYTIRTAVLKVCQLSEVEFMSDKHSHYIVKPRQIFYYLSRKHTDNSFPAIGIRSGRKDHSTVIHGVGKVTERIAAGDAKTIAFIAAIEAELGVGQ